MIQTGTLLKIFDNSGIKKIKVIRTLEALKKKGTDLGKLVTGSVRKIRNKNFSKNFVKKGDVKSLLIIQTKKIRNRKDGQKISFFNNGALLTDKKKNPLSSRVSCFLCKEFRKNIKLNTLISKTI